MFDEGQCRIFGVDRGSFVPSLTNIGKLIHPEDWQRLRTAFSDPEKIEQAHQIEFRIVRPDGELRWCIGAAAATVDASGRIVRLSGVTVDITDRKFAEERQLLLAREVDHRARNALAVVQAIVRLTQAKNTPAYVDAVEGRIRALAQTHSLLSQSRWQGADIGKLVREELGPYMSARAAMVAMEGPPVYLPPDTAQIVALALHELATNAAKYGALSQPSGRLAVQWQLESGSVALSWTETGGPGVNQPSAQGFGTKIINSSIKRQMGGSVVFDWQPGGLHCRMSIPYGIRKRLDGEQQSPRDGSNLVQFKAGQTKRILLVEDEVLVGMMMRDVLTDIGFFVAGPFCTMAEAVSAAQAQQFDGAVLDLNLGGELAYPVANLLRAQSVPFLFVTGYGQDAVDGKFGQIPILQKPIDREALERSMRALVEQPETPMTGVDVAAKTALSGGAQVNV
jgi:PAS domain S-box-containing protein